jgi:predicted TIM-barrel fold metal-dependent hydrolase
VDDPGVHEIVAEAHDGRLPILIHAGRGIPGLGEHCWSWPRGSRGRRFILAHVGIATWHGSGARRRAPERLLRHCVVQRARPRHALHAGRAGQILYATDIPFGSPRHSTVLTLRCALQAGLSSEQIATVAGAQLERLVAGEDRVDVGPAPGPGVRRLDPLLHCIGH